MMKQWIVQGKKGIDSLELQEVPIPSPEDYEVLVKFHAASLNYRDIVIANGKYVWTAIVPGSDAAGEVVKAGPKVTRFSVGQRVSPIFHLKHLYGSFDESYFPTSLGAKHDGVFRQYAVYNEESCVEIPSNLSYREAATLPCAAVTAWNTLYGGPRKLKPGETVLVQGTGGVSIFALQFAKMGGAQVIATTSGPEKADRLKVERADHIINYKEDLKWGETAKKLSHRGRGADFIIEIGGANTMAQSAQAAAVDCQVSVIGNRAGPREENGHIGESHGTTMFTTRRILVGSRQLNEEMNTAIEVNDVKPIIDAKTFRLSELKEAYTYSETGQHFGKVVLDID
ncbi:GroES-like protein [Aspergillus heteromorphus CBS 117.55]|uniref:GroES-like protein n=1 Tax=Aspergillus heteromorphus CBS 117.55 TaxID=1448321 RepID=A0A317WP56_9EURO|nr:GroES-like protein [Aspergillus heteromorphus CBS 117.55]PWY88269.1 GroES-like protein [Aspergillus heteromorphus CBS 117.55]